MAITYDINKDPLYQEGVEKGVSQTASNMKKAGFSVDDIIKATGLTKKQIDAIS